MYGLIRPGVFVNVNNMVHLIECVILPRVTYPHDINLISVKTLSGKYANISSLLIMEKN